MEDQFVFFLMFFIFAIIFFGIFACGAYYANKHRRAPMYSTPVLITGQSHPPSQGQIQTQVGYPSMQTSYNTTSRFQAAGTVPYPTSTSSPYQNVNAPYPTGTNTAPYPTIITPYPTATGNAPYPTQNTTYPQASREMDPPTYNQVVDYQKQSPYNPNFSG